MDMMISFKKFLRLTESQSDLVKDLVEMFGSNLAFNHESFQFTQSNLDLVQKILNKHMFESKLDKCSIEYLSLEQIDQKLKSFGSKETLENIFSGMHFVRELHDNPRLVQHPRDFEFDDEMIFINSSFVPSSSLEGVIAVLCHEMIHSYDLHYGEYRKFFHYESLTNNRLNYHHTPTFREKMRQANKMGIHVVETLEKDETYAEFDQKAYDQLLSTLAEADNRHQIGYSDEELSCGYAKIGSHHTNVIGKHTCIITF